MYQPKVTSEVSAAMSPPAPEEPVPSLEKAVQELPSDMGGCATTPVTPEPRVPTYPEMSEPKFKHATYKSRRVGFFCRDCKQTSTDPSWFRHQPCVPDEYKSPEDDEVHSPDEGEGESIQQQILLAESSKEKLSFLEELKQEEARLERLLALKSSQSVQGGDEKMEVEMEVEGSKSEQKATIVTVANDNMETLPWEPETLSPLDIPPILTEAEKAESLKEVEKMYERDMEGWENDRMKRDDKDFVDPFARNFKCPRVEAVVSNQPETTAQSLKDLFSDFQDAASTADRKTTADLVQKLKRSLDDFMTGGDFSLSGSHPSALEQQSKARKVDQVERVEQENGEEAEEDSKKKDEEQKNHEKEEKDIAGKDKEDTIEEEKDVKPNAVRNAKYVSPTMQTKLTGSYNPNDEEDENDENNKDEQEEEEEEVKPKRKRRAGAKAKAKAKSKGKIRKTTKAKEVANKEQDKGQKTKDKASDASAKSKAKVKSTSGKAPAKGKSNEEASGSMDPVKRAGKGNNKKGISDLCEACVAERKKLRSFQSCAYKVARANALKEGKDLQEAAKIGQQVSQLKM